MSLQWSVSVVSEFTSVRAARVLSPKPHISYPNLGCLVAYVLPFPFCIS